MHRPSFYAERFQRFMCNTAFKKIPCKCLGTAAPVAAAAVSGFSLLGSHGGGRWMTARALGSLVCCVASSFLLEWSCLTAETLEEQFHPLAGSFGAQPWKVAALGVLYLPSMLEKWSFCVFAFQ